MNNDVRFDVPPEYRAFTPFGRLPPELRQRIWALSASTPGIQFLKLKSTNNSWRFLEPRNTAPWIQTADPSPQSCVDEIAREVASERRPRRARDIRLVPQSPAPQTNISYYPITRRQLAALSATCREARAVVQFLRSRRGDVKLDEGLVVSLGDADDVVFLEYLPRRFEVTGCSFSIDIKCCGLRQIRRLAVRFCHDWNTKTTANRCVTCGRYHATRTGAVYPVHLYQFLARHLPRLEEFYFVDYFMLRKRTWPSICLPPRVDKRLHHVAPISRAFYGTNRAFVEVNNKDWQIESSVIRTLSWLRDRFVRYANASRYSRHRKPEDVFFGILGCEWDITPPEESRTVHNPSTSKGRNKRPDCQPHAARARRPTPRPGTMPAVVFGGNNAVLSNFVFSFRCDPPWDSQGG